MERKKCRPSEAQDRFDDSIFRRGALVWIVRKWVPLLVLAIPGAHCTIYLHICVDTAVIGSYTLSCMLVLPILQAALHFLHSTMSGHIRLVVHPFSLSNCERQQNMYVIFCRFQSELLLLNGFIVGSTELSVDVAVFRAIFSFST